MIRKEIEEQQFERARQRVILKSALETYDGSYLNVVTGKINQEKYNYYVENAKTMVVCFPDTYKYRVSAVVMEAIRNRIPVLGSGIRLIEFYKEAYPSIFEICTYSDLSYKISGILNCKSEEQATDFQRFINDHSDMEIQNAMKNTLQHVKHYARKGEWL